MRAGALLGAVDALSAGVVAYTLDTNVAGIGAMLDFTQLASVQNPAVALLFAAVILVAVVIYLRVSRWREEES